MKKHALIFHGTRGTNQSYWIPWLKKNLETSNYEVFSPTLKDTLDYADLNVWASQIPKNIYNQTFDLIVAHSAGCPLTLKLLVESNIKAKKVILVAGFTEPLHEKMPLTHPTLYQLREERLEKIKQNCKNFTFIHSNNDPWGCDINQGLHMQAKLGGRVIIEAGEGHFGSDAFNQPYKTFPLLLRECFTS